MTLHAAFKHFLKSGAYKQDAKVKDSKGGKLRSYAARFDAGKLGHKAMTALLRHYGYTVTPEDWKPPK